MKLTLTYVREDGDLAPTWHQLGPKTVDEWAAPNGDESLLIYMLRQLEQAGHTSVRLEQEGR